MNRIDRTFKRLRKEGRCGFVAYVTCGDPDAETTVRVIEELEATGADCIELGIPFSDPIADGPVIQAASFRAIQGGVTVSGCLEIAAKVRERSEIPIVAFSYLNPILRYGDERFADDAAEAGVDGVLLTDLPPESADEVRSAFRRSGLHSIFLLAPNSPDDRVKLVGKRSGGFVYYVSTTGVTGARRELDPDLAGRLDEVRMRVKLPLAVGFGISEHDHYLALAPHCDAVVVGSAIVRAIHDGEHDGAAKRAGEVVRRILGKAQP